MIIACHPTLNRNCFKHCINCKFYNMVVTIGNKTESLETPCGEVSPCSTSRPWEQRLGSSQRYLPPLAWDLSTLQRIHEYVLQALVFYQSAYSILLIVQRTLNLKHQAFSNHEIIAGTNCSSCISKREQSACFQMYIPILFSNKT